MRSQNSVHNSQKELVIYKYHQTKFSCENKISRKTFEIYFHYSEHLNESTQIQDPINPNKENLLICGVASDTGKEN